MLIFTYFGDFIMHYHWYIGNNSWNNRYMELLYNYWTCYNYVQVRLSENPGNSTRTATWSWIRTLMASHPILIFISELWTFDLLVVGLCQPMTQWTELELDWLCRFPPDWHKTLKDKQTGEIKPKTFSFLLFWARFFHIINVLYICCNLDYFSEVTNITRNSRSCVVWLLFPQYSFEPSLEHQVNIH